MSESTAKTRAAHEPLTPVQGAPTRLSGPNSFRTLPQKRPSLPTDCNRNIQSLVSNCLIKIWRPL
jgi:hypothetical protein